MTTLLRRGLVAERGAGGSSGGRPPVILGFDDDRYNAFGVELDADTITVLRVNLRGETLDVRRTPFAVAEDPDGALAYVSAMVCDMLLASGHPLEQGFERFVGSDGRDWFDGNSANDYFIGGAGDDLFRGRSGADVFEGGAGSDMFRYLLKDVVDGGIHQGVDTITDFEDGDLIDIYDLTKGNFDSVSDVVRLTADGGGTVVSVLIDGAFQDVVRLDNFTVDNLESAGDGMFIY